MNPLTLYLCSASREHARAAQWAANIRANPLLKLASNWHDSAGKWAGKDALLPIVDQRNCASLDLVQLGEASVLWMLYPAAQTIGAFVELGFAIAHHKRIYVSGHGCSNTIFTSLSVARDPDDRVVYHEICRYAESLPYRSARPVEALGSERPAP